MKTAIAGTFYRIGTKYTAPAGYASGIGRADYANFSVLRSFCRAGTAIRWWPTVFFDQSGKGIDFVLLRPD
ncbi:hypothetical protein Poly51_23250 [Rubripirellula tenax]|uniref:Uncharacterized protein n=1 Tax=Rubripirellula tenax TaxID=2528015 RepID=A0A5C6F5B4_9BACT|nr:hypothetical protein [Rubripirellula tenax]TWU56415.1 hypothetical protein Poly51_23250 [Rubripirellula tenax]